MVSVYNSIIEAFIELAGISVHGVIVRLKVVDREFVPSRIKPNTIKLVFAALMLCTQQIRVRAKTGWLGIRKICPSVATCLPADCCFGVISLRLCFRRNVLLCISRCVISTRFALVSKHYKNSSKRIGLV